MLSNCWKLWEFIFLSPRTSTSTHLLLFFFLKHLILQLFAHHLNFCTLRECPVSLGFRMLACGAVLVPSVSLLLQFVYNYFLLLVAGVARTLDTLQVPMWRLCATCCALELYLIWQKPFSRCSYSHSDVMCGEFVCVFVRCRLSLLFPYGCVWV